MLLCLRYVDTVYRSLVCAFNEKTKENYRENAKKEKKVRKAKKFRNVPEKIAFSSAFTG